MQKTVPDLGRVGVVGGVGVCCMAYGVVPVK